MLTQDVRCHVMIPIPQVYSKHTSTTKGPEPTTPTCIAAVAMYSGITAPPLHTKLSFSQGCLLVAAQGNVASLASTNEYAEKFAIAVHNDNCPRQSWAKWTLVPIGIPVKSSLADR